MCLLLGTRGRLEASSVTELRLCSETMNRLPPVLVLLDASLALAPDLGEGAAHAATRLHCSLSRVQLQRYDRSR